MDATTPSSLLIAMPSDDELYTAFIEAIRNGVHENIKSTADKLSGFIGNAKDCIKNLINVDAKNGLQLAMTIEKWNQVLAAFISKQWRLMRNTLKILLSTIGASTFTDFIAKMKKDPKDVEMTTGTLSKIMTLFFAKLGEKYLTKENETSIKEKIASLFA